MNSESYEASISASFSGFGGSASLGFSMAGSESSSTKSAESSATSERILLSSYVFPKMKLNILSHQYGDEGDYEFVTPSAELLDFFERKGINPKSVLEFAEQYGLVIPSIVVVGGKLTHESRFESKSSYASSGKSDSEAFDMAA